MNFQPFNPLTVPIKGTNLIEASAGTGKTYSIAALFTRLIVLEKMPVERILTVTFTRAANAELKTRLRARLENVLTVLEKVPDSTNDNTEPALQAYCTEYYPNDNFIFPLLQKALKQECRARLLIRLKAAISQFDNAAIYTIHGFCQRLLHDYAFLCQIPFDIELVNNNHEQMLTAAQDFWRKNVSTNPLTAQMVFKHRQTPQTALAAIKNFVGRPYLNLPQYPLHDLNAAHTQLKEIKQQLSENLCELEEIFWKLFESTLNKNSFRESSYRELFAVLKQSVRHNNVLQLPANAQEKASFLKYLNNFSHDVLPEKLLKNKSIDDTTQQRLQILADLGSILEKIDAIEKDTLANLQRQLLQHLNHALAEYRKNHHNRSFNDLLLDVHQAVTHGANRKQLVQVAAENWQIALIDEFQDTDPLQYEIFSRLFIAQKKPLFLVGDPKQAIYSFRGADIYAYLQAAHDADHHYTLNTNHRSHSALVKGINALFLQKKQPFKLDGIHYTDVAAVRETSRLSGSSNKAVQVRWLNRSDGNSNKDTLYRCAAESCADEIATMLNEAAENRLHYQTHTGTMPLQSGQIAVLVRTHNEGQMIAAELKKRRLQSVLLHRQSVFATEEAKAIAALLGFWLSPKDTKLLQFLLSSILFGKNAAELYALNHNEEVLLSWITSAQTAAETWQQHGIYTAIQQFAAKHGIETQLLARGNERSLTNYHQIIERLAEENVQNANSTLLHQWLLTQIQAARNDNVLSENNLMRLESDDNLIKIVTIHAAKGLQYPVVFCPFAWDTKKTDNSPWQIIHRNGQAELLPSHRLNQDDQKQLADETLSENLRLLYVALTRAQEQLIIYTAHCSSSAQNPLFYLLSDSPDGSKADKTAFKNDWQRFLDTAPAGFGFTETLPTAATYRHAQYTNSNYRAVRLPERSFDIIRHTSFTALSRYTHHHDTYSSEEIQPAIDHSEAAPTAVLSENQSTDHICHFPSGIDAGVCLHEILEKFDFTATAVSQSGLINTTLVRYGFDIQWQNAVAAMLEHTRTAPLPGGNTLASTTHYLPEMAFTLHMHDFRLKHLQQWCAQSRNGLPAECATAAQLLSFNDVHGFLNGFIDIVCAHTADHATVIDYKSNYLGTAVSDYRDEAIIKAVAQHHYYLQALIYAIAVARHFQSCRQPLHTVSVRYLFLRGLNGSSNGIWTWDIDTASLAEWL